jgi:DNA-binding YbaB/EbfC family protein
MAGLGDLSNLLKHAQQMKDRLGKTQEELKTKIVDGTAGGGMVKVQVNGAFDVVSLRIDPQAVDPNDVAALEDLILVAMRQALERARAMSKQELDKITSGMSLPGLF